MTVPLAWLVPHMEHATTATRRKVEGLAEEGGSAVPAVDRTLDILEYLSGHSTGLTLSELSTALKLPKNTASRILGTLRSRGYVVRDRVEKRFNLTRKFFMLTQPHVGDVSLVSAAMGPMRKLRDATCETVQLGIRVDLEGIIIDKIEALHPLRIAVDVGLRFKLHNNAPGKVLLAFMPPQEREATIERLELTASTPRTITDRDELRSECERVIANGYATDYAEADEGIHCVAAPIFDRDHHLAATIWVSAPSRRMSRDSFPVIGRQVMEAAREISRALHS